MIIENGTNRVIYLHGTLSADGVLGAGFVDPTTTTANATQVDTPEIPAEFVQGKSQYNAESQQWTHPEPDVEERRAALLARCTKERDKAFYTNPVIPFPVTEKEIHFRNENDRANIGDKTLNAALHVFSGNPSAEMRFTPVDGNQVAMTAQQMVTAFSALAAEKDAVFYAYKDIKDAILSAVDNSELDAAEQSLNAI